MVLRSSAIAQLSPCIYTLCLNSMAASRHEGACTCSGTNRSGPNLGRCFVPQLMPLHVCSVVGQIAPLCTKCPCPSPPSVLEQHGHKWSSRDLLPAARASPSPQLVLKHTICTCSVLLFSWHLFFSFLFSLPGNSSSKFCPHGANLQCEAHFNVPRVRSVAPQTERACMSGHSQEVNYMCRPRSKMRTMFLGLPTVTCTEVSGLACMLLPPALPGRTGELAWVGLRAGLYFWKNGAAGLRLPLRVEPRVGFGLC